MAKSAGERAARAIFSWFFRLYCEGVFTTEIQRGKAATKNEKANFTTKVTKSTKLRNLKISMSETFVAGAGPEHSRRVCFVVR